MTGVSNIDKYQLGPEVRDLNLKYPGKHQKIAEIINKNHEIEKITISRFNVRKWIKDNGLARNKDEAIEKMSKELLARDEQDALEYHNDMYVAERENIKAIIESDLPPQKKLEEIRGVYSGSLGRTLDSFGYGKQAGVQINQQFNFDEKMKEIVQIVIEETNNGGRVYRDNIIRRFGILGGVV